jgi:hypothetical protein
VNNCFSIITSNAETQRREDAEKIENILAEQIMSTAIEVHRSIGGPGLLESLYEDALCYELKCRNIPVQSQISIPVVYKNHTLRDPMRLESDSRLLQPNGT